MSRLSSAREPRSARGMRMAVYSAGLSPPTPTPKVTRPPESTSRLAMVLAMSTGSRRGRMTTSLAMRTREVRAAKVAMSVVDSKIGRCHWT